MSLTNKLTKKLIYKLDRPLTYLYIYGSSSFGIYMGVSFAITTPFIENSMKKIYPEYTSRPGKTNIKYHLTESGLFAGTLIGSMIAGAIITPFCLPPCIAYLPYKIYKNQKSNK